MSAREPVWVVTIGDELLRGEIVDSNKSHLSERMLALELESTRHVSVPDDPALIEEVLRQAAARARVVLVSGGLGPTRDDITTEVAARTFGRKLVRDPAALESIRAFFRRFNREMAENNAKQADFPEGAEVLANPMGTAPGFRLEVPHADPGEPPAQLFFMPGVPRELYRMIDEEIVPRIAARLGRKHVVRARLLRTFGIGESNLDRLLADLAQGDADTRDRLPHPVPRQPGAHPRPRARRRRRAAAARRARARDPRAARRPGRRRRRAQARRDRRRAAPRAQAHDRRRRVAHRRAHREPAHRRAGQLRVPARGRGRLRERREGARARRVGRSHRPTRSGLGAGGAPDGRGRAPRARAPTSAWPRPASPGPTAAAPRSPSARSGSRSPTARARSRTATSS